MLKYGSTRFYKRASFFQTEITELIENKSEEATETHNQNEECQKLRQKYNLILEGWIAAWNRFGSCFNRKLEFGFQYLNA